MIDEQAFLDPKTKDALLKKLLWVPCETQEHLWWWVRTYIGTDLPMNTVDSNSNSNPLAMLWEIYSKGRAGDQDYTRVLLASARGGGKTFLASIIELLMVLHLERNVGHGAALMKQSQFAARNIQQFINNKYISPFISIRNQTKVQFTKYKGDEDTLCQEEYDSLPESEQTKYRQQVNFIEIIVLTRQGANGLHASFVCVDGDTKILAKKQTPGNRVRVSLKASGIHNALSGRAASGHQKLFAESIENPSQIIEVLSFNFKTGELEFKPVTHSHRRLANRRKITLSSGKNIVCTPDHPLYEISKGFVRSSDLSIGDTLVVLNRGRSEMNFVAPDDEVWEERPAETDEQDEWDQVVLGSLLGDGGIYRVKTANPHYRTQHSPRQRAYMDWKKSIISRKVRVTEYVGKSGYTGEPLYGFYTGNSPALMPYLKVRTELDGLSRLGPMGLAVWYMDDGCKGNSFRLSTECFTHDQQLEIIAFLRARFGLETKIMSYSRGEKTYECIVGGISEKRRLSEICKPYVHPEIAYKFDMTGHQGECRFCKKTFFFIDRNGASVTCSDALCRKMFHGSVNGFQVTAIEDLGEDWVYDFTVADNHNFFGNGILNKNCLDELELADPIAVEETKYIPEPTPDGKSAITFLTSSRKFAFGLIQHELDKAEKTGLHYRSWGICDVAKACPPTRHLPEKPKIPIYVDPKELTSISEAAFLALPREKQDKFSKTEGYEGCLSKCKMFAACKGQLATKQVGPDMPFLKTIPSVQDMIVTGNPDTVLSQLLCHKPSSEGMIYPRLDKELHIITAAQVAKKLSGEMPVGPFGLNDLIKMSKGYDVKWKAGIDFGTTHNFAVVLTMVYDRLGFIVGSWSMPGLDPAEKLDLLERTIQTFDPDIYPDTANPDMIKFLKKNGFRCKDWKKGPGSVASGIETVRYKIRPSVFTDDPELFFVSDGPGTLDLFRDASQYHWALDSNGDLSDSPDEVVGRNANDEILLDDALDAMRYVIMNTFRVKGQMHVPEDQPAPSLAAIPQSAPTQRVWSNQIMQHALGTDYTQEEAEDTSESKGKNKGIFWDFD